MVLYTNNSKHSNYPDTLVYISLSPYTAFLLFFFPFLTEMTRFEFSIVTKLDKLFTFRND